MVAGNGTPIIRKQCNRCSRELILNADNFHRDVDNPDGFRDVCKECRRKDSEKTFLSEIQEQISALDRSSLMMLQKMAEEGTPSTALPHAVTLLEDMMMIWGGSKGLAQHMMKEFMCANPGSQIRLKYVQLMVNFILKVSQENYIMPELQSLDNDKLEQLRKEQEQRLRERLGVTDPEYDAEESD